MDFGFKVVWYMMYFIYWNSNVDEVILQCLWIKIVNCDIDLFVVVDFEFIGYKVYQKINMIMVV